MSVNKTTLLCVDAGGGHNCELSIGLSKYRDVTTVWVNRNKHGLDYLVPGALYGFNKVPKRGDEIIIVSCITYDHFKEFLSKRRVNIKQFLSNYKRVIIIVTDGRFARNPDYYNTVWKGYEVICTPCKIHWRVGKAKEYYQPFDFTKWNLPEKEAKLIISHSPFNKRKRLEKGTALIKSIVDSLGFDLDIIEGISWRSAIIRKARAHIFIDQLSHWQDYQFKNMRGYTWNALGKSGIEAMHLGCLTFTRGKKKNGLIPPPPVVWCDETNLQDQLEYYINNKAERDMMAEAQKEWALRYASPDFAAKNVLGL